LSSPRITILSTSSGAVAATPALSTAAFGGGGQKAIYEADPRLWQTGYAKFIEG
jgi:hypothetical protein